MVTTSTREIPQQKVVSKKKTSSTYNAVGSGSMGTTTVQGSVQTGFVSGREPSNIRQLSQRFGKVNTPKPYEKQVTITEVPRRVISDDKVYVEYRSGTRQETTPTPQESAGIARQIAARQVTTPIVTPEKIDTSVPVKYTYRDVEFFGSIFPSARETRTERAARLTREGKITLPTYVELKTGDFFNYLSKPFANVKGFKTLSSTKVEGFRFTDIGKFVFFQPAMATTGESLFQAIRRGGLEPETKSQFFARIKTTDKGAKLELIEETKSGGLKIRTLSEQNIIKKGDKFYLAKGEGATFAPIKKGTKITEYEFVGAGKDLGKIIKYKDVSGGGITLKVGKEIGKGTGARSIVFPLRETTVKQGIVFPTGKQYISTKGFTVGDAKYYGTETIGITKKVSDRSLLFVGGSGKYPAGRPTDINTVGLIFKDVGVSKAGTTISSGGTKLITQKGLTSALSTSLTQQQGAASKIVQQSIAGTLAYPLPKVVPGNLLEIQKPYVANVGDLESPPLTTTMAKPKQDEGIITKQDFNLDTGTDQVFKTGSGQKSVTFQFNPPKQPEPIIELPKQDQPQIQPQIPKTPQITPQIPRQTEPPINIGYSFRISRNFGFALPLGIPSGMATFPKSRAIGKRTFGRTPSLAAAIKFDLGIPQFKFPKEFERSGLFERALI